MAALVRTGWGNGVQEEKRETEIAEESIPRRKEGERWIVRGRKKRLQRGVWLHTMRRDEVTSSLWMTARIPRWRRAFRLV